VTEDIVTRLRHGFHCPCEHWGHERECEIHQAFVDAQLRQVADEIERLRAAGDALVTALDEGEWTTDVLPAIAAWEEVRRG
jgi:hypothetical protein